MKNRTTAKLKYTNFTMSENGFVGHMAEPESHKTDKAVIVIMGGEKSVLPGIKIAERFVDFGITGLSVSLFGAEGLPDAVSAKDKKTMTGHSVAAWRGRNFRLFLRIFQKETY